MTSLSNLYLTHNNEDTPEVRQKRFDNDFDQKATLALQIELFDIYHRLPKKLIESLDV